jgi:hypothetical protein
VLNVYSKRIKGYRGNGSGRILGWRSTLALYTEVRARTDFPVLSKPLSFNTSISAGL